MGTFGTTGIAAELEKFEALKKGTAEACEKAVEAGAKVLVRKLKANAPVYKGRRRDVRPGALRDSIKAGKVKYWYTEGYYCEVGPVGKDHGQDLARIGNILEYGRHGRQQQSDERQKYEEAQKHGEKKRKKKIVDVEFSKYYNDMEKKAWFNPAIMEAEDEVKQAMQKAFEEAQGNGG